MNVLPLRRQQEQRRVLLLEDHDLLRSSMVRTLCELPNVSAVGVRTVHEAIEEIDTAAPDLVVSDLDLPDGSGLELIPHLSGSNRPSIVFVSGHISRFEAQLDHYPGIVVLDKPLPARTLKYIVAEQLDEERTPAAPFATGDYIQLACIGRHSVRIDVHGSDVDGTIYIKGGRLWSAVTGRCQGRAALRLLTFTEGTRVTCGGVMHEHGPANLPDLPWEQMLLDLAKEHDEGTREIPVVDSDDDIDFSSMFEDDVDPEPPLAPQDDASSDARFERLLDEAHDALLAKDYSTALTAFETASAIRPNDSVVEGNVARLRELVQP